MFRFQPLFAVLATVSIALILAACGSDDQANGNNDGDSTSIASAGGSMESDGENFGQNEEGINWIGVVKVAVPTGEVEVLAVQPGGREHPRHTHPNVSPCSSKVGFTTAVGKKNARVAIVGLD